MYADYIVPGPEGRVAPGTGTLEILAPPGIYTVKLEVLKDPNSGGSEADIAAQMQSLFAIRDDLEAAADAVHRIEAARTQLAALESTVSDSAVRKAARDLQQKYIDLEMNFVDLRLTGRGQDGVRFASKLIDKIVYLGDQIGSSDFKPTDQAEEVRQLLHAELGTQLAALDALQSKELMAFNEMLRTKNVPYVIVGGRRSG